ncbi:GIY-YIG nuclease family protein [Pontibacter toksunensis]|uniref:GIY-YIG nuclease family protein n=1 Tax=Pontibacter toksunensis TaxID=1332631 RepID=A0ABW6BMR1_9BACT
MQVPQPHYYIYILGDQPRSSLRIGIAGDLQQHIQQVNQGSAQYAAVAGEQPKLVYYEHYEREEIALNREREIKNGGEDFTLRLVESMNPNWLDLSDTLA